MAQPALQLALNANAPAYSLGISVIVIGILLSGLALGLSRAIGSRKLWAWGVEEFVQSVINAAMLGGIVAACSVSGALLASAMQADANEMCIISQEAQNAPIDYSVCRLENAISQSEQVGMALSSASFRLGMLSKIEVDFGAVKASVFDSFSYPAKAYSDWAYLIAGISAQMHAEKEALQTIAKTAFALFLPAGLVLRMFFATRKLGGAIMAGAIGFYIICPLVFATLAENSGIEAAGSGALLSLEGIDAKLAPLPQLDFRKSAEIANLVMSLDGGNVSAQAYLPYGRMGAYMGALEAFAYVYPLVALAIGMLGTWQLAGVLGAEFRLDLLSEV